MYILTMCRLVSVETDLGLRIPPRERTCAHDAATLLHSNLQPFVLLNNTAHHRDLRHVTSILESYYDIDHRPRKKSKFDAPAVSWHACGVERKDRGPINDDGESGGFSFKSLDIFEEEEEGQVF